MLGLKIRKAKHSCHLMKEKLLLKISTFVDEVIDFEDDDLW